MKKKLKVAILSSTIGGLGHYAAHLAKPLSSFCDLTFITYKKLYFSGKKVNKIEDEFIAKKIKSPLFLIEHDSKESLKNLLDFFKKNPFDLANLHFCTTAKPVFPYYKVLFSRLKKKIPIVFTCHDVLPHLPKKEDLQILSSLFKLADGFIVGNEKEYHNLVDNFPVDKKGVTIIPHGLYEGFDQKRYIQEKARRFLKIKEKNVVLFFGFLRRYKGLLYLIRAFSKVIQKKPNTLLYISSSTDLESEEEIYKKEIEKLNLKNKVRFITDYIPSSKIEPVFKASDLVALPYIGVTQSGILNLAFAFKKPVVVTKTFSEAQKIDKKMGFSVPPKDSNLLAKALLNLLQNKEKAQKMGEEGYKYAKKEHSFEKVAKETFDFFLKIVKEKK